MNQKILLIDDEPGIRKFLRISLTAHSFSVKEAGTAVEGLTRMKEERPDLVVLDLGLPDMSGIEVLKAVREWSDVPVIVLSVREREHDKVEALDAGADDYLTKPFGLSEMMARVRAALRRSKGRSEIEALFTLGDLVVDLDARSVTMKGSRLQLTPTEYELLKSFVRNAGRVLTHHQLLSEVWGEEYVGDAHMLRVNISNLRKKIEPDPVRPRYILTEPGVGYRLRG